MCINCVELKFTSWVIAHDTAHLIHLSFAHTHMNHSIIEHSNLWARLRDNGELARMVMSKWAAIEQLTQFI